MQSRAIYTYINYLQCKIENENDFHLWAHLALSPVTPIFSWSLFLYIPTYSYSVWIKLHLSNIRARARSQAKEFKLKHEKK